MSGVFHPPVSFSTDGNSLAVIHNSRLHVWDVGTSELRESPSQTECTCVAWMSPPAVGKKRKSQSSRPMEWVAIGTTSGDVIVWDMLKVEAVATMSSSDPVVCLCCHGDSVYSGHSGGQVRLWSTTSSSMQRCWSVDKQKVVVISVIGDSLLTGNVSLKLWPLNGPSSGNKPSRKFPAHGSELQQIVSLDETHFITSATADRLVNIWSVDVKSTPVVSFVSPEAITGFSVHQESTAVTVVTISEEGSLYLCHWVTNDSNGKSDKPLLPSCHITIATEDSIPNPIPVWGVQLVNSHELLCCYGYHLKPTVEKISIPEGQKELCLFRKVAMETGKKSGKQRKSIQSNQSNVSQLGPSNLVETLPLMSRDPVLKAEYQQQETAALPKKQREIPTAQSLSSMLIQAIHSDDKKLLNTVLMSGKANISETVQRLPTSIIVPFLHQLQVLVDTQPQMLEKLVPWLHAIMVTHMSYLATVPDLMSSLSVLRHLLDMRVNLFDKLCKLHGKLDLILTQVGNQDSVHHSMRPDAEITIGMDVNDDDKDEATDDDLSSHDSEEGSHDDQSSTDDDDT